ncbi:LysM domain-containing protein [Pseudoalteromonas sp. TB64]|uniref:LysM peptidoglycan-binding domain-containing protein n=1 Tax=Pseudoalteromonas sp. TB64 TaxID=1938600 RepID=UPI0004655639|nr:LysM domain-containing protein [Pseudoalteromonas sp. TB64]
MKNVKLTLVTALSVLALTFAGVASADNNSGSDNHKQQNEVTYTKKVNKNVSKNNTKTVVVTKNVKNNNKKVVVKSTPTKKVVVTKTVVKQPTKTKQKFYTVRSGDNLSLISAKTGISVKKLAKLNQIKHVNNIRIGQVLIIL